MKKQLFSLGIFRETLKQTAPYGIFVTLLYGILSFSIIMSKQFFSRELIAYDAGVFTLVPMLFASVITAVAFGFITSTTASDFYGAVSESKLCKLISVYLGVLFQCIVPVLLVTGVSSLLFGVLISPERLYLSEHIILLLNIFSGCFLASALTLMGVLLMGRFASGLIFALQCLYLPLAIVLLVGDLSVSGLQGATLDLTAFQTLPVWAVMNYKEMSVSLESLPVTFVTGCVALVIAYFTFEKRGYEISRARTVGGIQILFNTLCAMPFALLAAGIMENIYLISNRNGRFDSLLPRLYTFLILALFASVICDAVCSKTFKKILRGVLGAMISVCLVIAIVGVGILIDNATDHMPIEVNTFKADIMTKESVPVGISEKYSASYQSKFVVELKKLSFKDETGKIEKALNSKEIPANSSSLRVEVTAKGGIRFTSSVNLSVADLADVLDRFMSDEEVMERVLKIERPSSKIKVFVNALRNGDTLTQKEQRDIYESFYNEYNRLTLEQKALVAGYTSGTVKQNFNLTDYNKDRKEEDKVDPTATLIYVLRPCGPDNYMTRYNLYKQLMPNTYEMIAERAK